MTTKRRQTYEHLLTPTKTDPDLCRMLYLAVCELTQRETPYPGMTKNALNDLYHATEWHYLTTRPKGEKAL